MCSLTAHARYNRNIHGRCSVNARNKICLPLSPTRVKVGDMEKDLIRLNAGGGGGDRDLAGGTRGPG